MTASALLARYFKKFEEHCPRVPMHVRVYQIFIIFQKRYGSVIFLFSSQKHDDMQILGGIGHP